MPQVKTLGLLLIAAALSGCATSWVVDSEVRSHGPLPGFTPGSGYQFERLPSQSDSEAARAVQADLEAMAAPALAAAGLRADTASPRYSIQVSARVSRVLSPWDSPWHRGGWGPHWHPYGGWGPAWGPMGYGPWFGGAYGGWGGPPPQPWYLREVSVLMRQLPGNEVVYETRARHDGPYNRSRDVLPVMFRAALQGFPNAPASQRRVDLPIGQASAERRSASSATPAAASGPAVPAIRDALPAPSAPSARP